MSLLGSFQSLYTPLFLTKDAFQFEFFKNVLVIAFSIFCFGISALGLFCISDLRECCLIVLAESGDGRVILLLYYLILTQKITKIFASSHHYASLHLGFCMILALGLLREVLVIFSYRNDYIFHLKENFAFHVVEYPVFHLTQCICINCQVCILLLIAS